MKIEKVQNKMRALRNTWISSLGNIYRFAYKKSF